MRYLFAILAVLLVCGMATAHACTDWPCSWHPADWDTTLPAGVEAVTVTPDGAKVRIVPDLHFTPGMLDSEHDNAWLIANKGHICDSRNVSGREKQCAFAAYDIDAAAQKARPWEVDHDISLELGGSNDIANLWPQTRDRSIKYNAWDKDKLEDRLAALVRQHNADPEKGISLAEAQDDIRGYHWVWSFRHYIEDVQTDHPPAY